MNFVCFHFLVRLSYKAFSHDVTAAILVFQKIEMAANKSVNQFISVWMGLPRSSELDAHERNVDV